MVSQMRVDLNLPWSCEKGAVEIIDADGGTAAYALSSSETPHIVKAVNNHDALVAMVEELKMLIRVTGPLTTARERADKLLNSLK